MNSTAAAFPLTVTEVPSRPVGSFPLTISVLVFHRRESPDGARFVPKMAIQAPGEIGVAKLASLTTALIDGGPDAPPGALRTSDKLSARPSLSEPSVRVMVSVTRRI